MDQQGARCLEEEGHDTGAGTLHQFAAPPPVSAEDAARELSQRMGVPCTAIPAYPPGTRRARGGPDDLVIDDGDVTCARADGTPEGAARQLEAMWQALDETGLPHLVAREQFQRRKRVIEAIMEYLAESERDWAQLHRIAAASPMPAGEAQTVVDAKALHDAQFAELFERIGAAL